jgi:hypothetical protein
VYIYFFSREITNYTVIYGAYIRFWPMLRMYCSCSPVCCPRGHRRYSLAEVKHLLGSKIYLATLSLRLSTLALLLRRAALGANLATMLPRAVLLKALTALGAKHAIMLPRAVLLKALTALGAKHAIMLPRAA